MDVNMRLLELQTRKAVLTTELSGVEKMLSVLSGKETKMRNPYAEENAEAEEQEAFEALGSDDEETPKKSKSAKKTTKTRKAKPVEEELEDSVSEDDEEEVLEESDEADEEEIVDDEEEEAPKKGAAKSKPAATKGPSRDDIRKLLVSIANKKGEKGKSKARVIVARHSKKGQADVGTIADAKLSACYNELKKLQ